MSLAFRWWYLAIAFIFTLFIAACNDDDDNDYHVGNTDYSASEEFAYSFLPPYQATSFVLEAVSGQASIQFVPDAVLDSIVVYGERRVESSSLADAEEHLADLQVLFTKTPDDIRFRTDQPDEAEGRNYIVEYHIEIPESMTLTLSQVNGPVWIHDMGDFATVSVVNGDLYLDGSGHAIASVVNGLIQIEDFNGSVNGSSVNGTIHAHVAIPHDGVCDLDVVNGSINLEIPDTTSAGFSASTTNGQVSFSGLTLNEAVVTPNSVSGVLGNGEGAIDLNNTNGNITATGY